MLLCGNRFGKSTAGAVEMIWRCLGIHPYRKSPVPIKAAILVQDFENHQRTIIHPKFLEWAPPGSIVDMEKHQSGAIKRYTFSTGSTIDVYSHDQDVRILEGSAYDYYWLDEPCPKRHFTAIWRSLVDSGGDLSLTGTPLTEPWLHEEWKKAQAGDPLRWVRSASSYENAKNLGGGNEELGRKKLDDFAAMLDDDEKAARIDGELIQVRGLIFKGWQRDVHLIPPFEWPATWPIIESIDPHPRKPYGVSWIGIAENGAKILLRSAYIEGVIDEVAKELFWHRQQIPIEEGRAARISRIVIDNYAQAPLMGRSHDNPTLARRSIREELEAFLKQRIEIAPKDVSQKIELFKTWLYRQKIDGRERCDFYAMDNVENQLFVTEIEKFQWDTFRANTKGGLWKDQPKKVDDDIIDSVLQVALLLIAGDSGTIDKRESHSAIKGLGTYGGSRDFSRRNSSLIPMRR
jgi:hypothetical protein